jgi:hypothetical protein
MIEGFNVPGTFEHLFEKSRKFPESFTVNLSCKRKPAGDFQASRKKPL